MKYGLLLGVLVITACAIATGPGAVATVGTTAEFKREMPASSPTVEDVLIQKEKK